MCALKTWKVFEMVTSSKDMVVQDPSRTAITLKVKIHRWWDATQLKVQWQTSNWPHMVTIKLIQSLCSNWLTTRLVAQSFKWLTLRRVRNRVAPTDTVPGIKAIQRTTLCKWACNRRCNSSTSKSSNRPKPFSRTNTSTTKSEHNPVTLMKWVYPDKTKVTMRSLNSEGKNLTKPDNYVQNHIMLHTVIYLLT